MKVNHSPASGPSSNFRFLRIPLLAALLLVTMPGAWSQLTDYSQPQIQAFSLPGTNSVTSVTFSQWGGPGPLTSVILNLSGAVSGGFEVFNTTGADLTVSNARTEQLFSFPGVGAPPAIFSETPMLLQTFPSTIPSFAVIEGFDSRLFVITNNMPIALTGSYDLTPYASYFTGDGTVTLNIYSTFNISGDGPRTLDRSGLTTAGAATLTLVPEPSTYALLIVSGLAGLVMWRRRRA
jgi:hypothetical protein